MKLQLFSTGKNSGHRPIRCLQTWPTAVFPALQLTKIQSDLDLHDYCIRHPARLTTFAPAVTKLCPTAAFTMAIYWFVDCAEAPAHSDIICGQRAGEFTVKRFAADATTDAQPRTPPGRRFIDPDESGYLWRRRIIHRRGDVLMFATADVNKAFLCQLRTCFPPV